MREGRTGGQLVAPACRIGAPVPTPAAAAAPAPNPCYRGRRHCRLDPSCSRPITPALSAACAAARMLLLLLLLLLTPLGRLVLHVKGGGRGRGVPAIRAHQLHRTHPHQPTHNLRLQA
eukprot:1158555-Pelagomonas_calceolata.AAC.7